MSTPTETCKATLHIELLADCPHCDHSIDLLDYDLGLNDEGQIIQQACPCNGDQWTDAHKSFEQDVTCPECGKPFIVRGIDW